MFKIIERLEWGPLATFLPNKKLPIYNWIYFKEGFSRDLVVNFIQMFKVKPGQVVLDPFCGVGTTLLACKELGIDSIGFDVLPIAVFATKVKTADYDVEKLKEAARDLFSKKFVPMSDMPGWTKRFFPFHTRQDITFFRHQIDQIDDGKIKDFFLLALIAAAIKCSWIWKDGGLLKIKKHPIPPFRKFYARLIKRMIKDCEKAEKSKANVFVNFCDARRLPLKAGKIDAVITSPPYLNQIDYTKVYAVEDWFVGRPRPGIRAYLGLRESFSHKMEPIEIYMDDMEQVLKELYRVCKPGAKLALIVGNAYIERKIIEVDTMLGQLAERIGFKVKEIIVLNKRFALEARTKKKGILRESAIVFNKQTKL
jgi:DNA modification methylase